MDSFRLADKEVNPLWRARLIWCDANIQKTGRLSRIQRSAVCNPNLVLTCSGFVAYNCERQILLAVEIAGFRASL